MKKDTMSSRNSTKPVVGRRLSCYDIFYEIHGDTATGTVWGLNIEDAKRQFKNIYGGWKINHVQKLK